MSRVMNAPLKVVQDNHGRLRDVHDQPIIIIFDTKGVRPRKSKLARTRRVTTEPQSFAFVNVTNPKESSESVRKLIRMHVMCDLRRRERQTSNDLKEHHCASLESQTYTGSDLVQTRPLSVIPPLPSANGQAFIVFPVEMQPYMHRLIHHYLSSIMYIMDPKQTVQSINSAWFSMVMTDPALFHTILCSSAIYIDLASGLRDSFVPQKHMLEAISLINRRMQRLDAADCFSDATITTIAFMAKVECARGNYADWNTHMNGLSRIIEVRGGMITLQSLLRQKIYSTEIMGCIETGSIPRFPSIDEYITIRPSMLAQTLCPGIKNLCRIYSFDPDFFKSLHEIDAFTETILNKSLSAVDLEPPTVLIRYRLLLWLGQGLTENQFSIVQQSIGFGAIIYISTLLPKPPVRGINYRVMLSNLKSYLVIMEAYSATRELLIWLLFMSGCISANTSRAWFVARLHNVIFQRGSNTWENVKKVLQKFWWVELLHEGPCQQLWEEANEFKSPAGIE